MFNISHKSKIKMEDMREKKGKSIKSVIASFTRLNPEELKREQRIKREKYVPYNAKRFGQTFLKFDAKRFGQTFLKFVCVVRIHEGAKH